MKKFFVIFSLLTALVSIFAVCSAQVTAETITLDEIFETNSILNLSKDHSALNYTETSVDADGTLNFKTSSQYTFFEGKIWFDSNTSFEESEVGGMQTCAYEDETTPGTFWYADEMSDYDSVTIIPSANYHDMLNQGWLQPYEGFNETVTETSEADGFVIVKTHTDIEGLEEYGTSMYYESEYKINAETGLISELTRSFFEQDELSAVDTIQMTYDEPSITECIPQMILTNGEPEEMTDLTVVINPGTENEETQNFHLRRGTLVTIGSTNGYSALFADEACTEEVYAPELDAESMTLYAKDGMEIPDYYYEE